jgi:hypothetical protein
MYRHSMLLVSNNITSTGEGGHSLEQVLIKHVFALVVSQLKWSVTTSHYGVGSVPG